MQHEHFNQLHSYVNDSVSWYDVIPNLTKDHGSITCPFCNRHNKSYLWPNYFKCFSSYCNQHGNKIHVYSKLNNLSYPQALSSLSHSSNITPDSLNSYLDSRNQLLSDVLHSYHDQLINKFPTSVEYLISRGLSYDFILFSNIGYSPNYNVLKDYDINVNTLRTHQLHRNNKDFFRNRIIFPISNHHSFLVHLTGRSFPSPNPDFKYLDSPTIPFIGSSKNYLLLEHLIPSYLNNNLDQPLFLVEGVLDTYTLYYSGFPVLGLLGLQKLLHHLPKLKSFKHIICVFDIDQYSFDHPHYSNQFKSWRTILPQLIDLQLSLGSNTQLSVCFIPSNLHNQFCSNVKDVNDLFLYLNKDKSHLYSFLLQHSTSLVEYFINLYKGDISHHSTILKLIKSTNQGLSSFQKYIPQDISTIDYILNVIS